MTLEWYVTFCAGVLATVGLVGIFAGAWLRSAPVGARSFAIGRVAMGLAGLLMLLAWLVGAAEIDQLFGGLMLLIFGTAVSLPVATPEHGSPDHGSPDHGAPDHGALVETR